jgi:hypothetical protein
MVPLTNPAVDANALETSVMKLWQEFLARYFDGGQHDVGAVANVQFPKVELQFQQSAVTQPLSDGPNLGLAPNLGVAMAAITLVWSESMRKWTAWENVAATVSSGPDGSGDGTAPNAFGAVLPKTRQEMCYERVAWNFWVRASGTNARAACKLAADRLAGLLGNKAETHLLGAKGVSRLKPSAPRAIQETDYVLRLVTCVGTLRYPVMSQV